MTTPPSGLTRALATTALATTALSQATERYVLDSPPFGPDAGFGSRASIVGDVDGDGFADVAVSASAGNVWPTPAGPDSGRVLLFSGPGGEFLRELVNTHTGRSFGRSVDGVGDWNGDGRADVAVGAEGSVQVFSGADGALLRIFTGGTTPSYGETVRSAGDVDGDLVEDLVVGAPTEVAVHRGSVFVYSSTGALLHRIDGTTNLQRLGLSVAPAGDVNGDGLADVLASSDTGGAFGTVAVRSGLDAAVLTTYVRQAAGAPGLDGGADLDGDLVPDFVVGEGASRVTAVSGATGAELHAVGGVGPTVALLGDVDGDGVSDYLAGHASSATTRLVSGTGAVLQTLPGADGVAGGEDCDGDGTPDFVLRRFDGIHVWTGAAPPPLVRYCAGDGTGAACPCPGTSLVFRETFLGGALPPGWTTTSADWHVTSGCGYTGLACQAPWLYIGTSTCGLGVPGSVSTPWIPLPAARRLTLRFCIGVRICAENHRYSLRVETQSGLSFGWTAGAGQFEFPTTVDLSELAGETVRVTWTFTHDGFILIPLPHGIWIDDVLIFTASGPGDAGEGCRNSTGEGGILLANGSTSASADDLQLLAAQLPPGRSGLFVVGDTTYTPPVAVGDGLVCTGGNARRYPGTTTGAGVATLSSPVAGSLGLIQPGGSYGFQFWHRDVADGQCAGRSNLTPGVRIAFTP